MTIWSIWAAVYGSIDVSKAGPWMRVGIELDIHKKRRSGLLLTAWIVLASPRGFEPLLTA